MASSQNSHPNTQLVTLDGALLSLPRLLVAVGAPFPFDVYVYAGSPLISKLPALDATPPLSILAVMLSFDQQSLAVVCASPPSNLTALLPLN